MSRPEGWRTVLIPSNDMKGSLFRYPIFSSPVTGIDPAQVPLALMTSALTDELPRYLVKIQAIIAEWCTEMFYSQTDLFISNNVPC